MAGMAALGREFDIITNASGVYFSLKNCSGVTFVCQASGASSVALTCATAFSGGTTSTFTTAHGFGQAGYWYQNTSDTGTAAWVKETAVWTTNSIALAQTTGYVSVFEVYVSQLADTYDYIAATGTNTGVIAILHDLTVQRNPANLQILGV